MPVSSWARMTLALRLEGFADSVGTAGSVSAQATHSTLGRSAKASIRSVDVHMRKADNTETICFTHCEILLWELRSMK